MLEGDNGDVVVFVRWIEDGRMVSGRVVVTDVDGHTATHFYIPSRGGNLLIEADGEWEELPDCESVRATLRMLRESTRDDNIRI